MGFVAGRSVILSITAAEAAVTLGVNLVIREALTLLTRRGGFATHTAEERALFSKLAACFIANAVAVPLVAGACLSLGTNPGAQVPMCLRKLGAKFVCPVALLTGFALSC